MPTEQKSRRATFRAAARSTTKPKRKRSPNNRHRPGYKQPNQIGTKLIGAYLPLEMADAFQMAVRAENKTMKEIITAFVAAKAKNYMTPETKQEVVEREVARVRAKYRSLHPTPNHA